MHHVMRIVAAIPLLFYLLTNVVEGQHPAIISAEAGHRREYFYAGGGYVNTKNGHIFQNQMYVEKLSPIGGSTREYPVVLLHGGGQSGTNWLNKPDGGVGWASRFVEQGYDVFIVDETTRGRSPWWPENGLPQSVFSAELVFERFTGIRNSTLWPQAKLHSQWPGSGKMGDPIFDKYYQSNVQYIVNTVEQETATKAASIALLDAIGPAVLITHSQGGLYGWAIADLRPMSVKALVQIEPKGPPFREAVFSTEFTRPWGLTTIPLGFDPYPTDLSEPLTMKSIPTNSSDRVDCLVQDEPARQLHNLANIPILVVTAEASYHAMYDHCTGLFLEQAGVRTVEHWNLGDIGIHGNGHLLFMELNSDAVAAALIEWIRRKAENLE
ncbi:hypothetical protein AJ79_05837 [Helicocarpus griseus UAMH5409]|uniref:AB hydrolase-1 domain-containing protein n=1 Tax=Helicocarpus griseus UAMH5409 TaxID=1447875 RepID=A0A2B7XJ95_9EURO|nr:hypothetical protein AJ79_05837 [Helicocarpus griseus UAMH5409]